MKYCLISASRFEDGGQAGHWVLLARALSADGNRDDAIADFVQKTGYQRTGDGVISVVQLTDQDYWAICHDLPTIGYPAVPV